jgi:hypothetical protein
MLCPNRAGRARHACMSTQVQLETRFLLVRSATQYLDRSHDHILHSDTTYDPCLPADFYHRNHICFAYPSSSRDQLNSKCFDPYTVYRVAPGSFRDLQPRILCARSVLVEQQEMLPPQWWSYFASGSTQRLLLP